MRSVRAILSEGRGSGLADRTTLPDVLLILLLAVLVVVVPLVVMGRGGGEWLQVQAQDSVLRIPLSEDGAYTLAGPLGDAKLIVQGGRARLVNAPCPLKLCEAMGPVDGPGEAIVCVPNRIAVTVTGRSEVDAVSR